MKKLVSVLIFLQAWGYDQPVTINLGFTNILEGGPVRLESGFYWYQYFEYYNAHKFLNGQGKPLGGVPSPQYNGFFGCSEFIYQTKDKWLFNAKCGMDLQLYYTFYSRIEKNSIGINDHGNGWSDPYLGLFLQWDPVVWWPESLFVHRLEFGASFPGGKYNAAYFINPGNGFYFINPNWAATLYLTPKWAISTDLNYLWSAKNKHNGIQAGQAIFLDYSMEYEIFKNFWLAVNGYFLQQYTDSKIDDVKAPGRRERVFAIGPGALYNPTNNLYFFGYLYFESKVKNRDQGINFFIRSVVHF